jgi:hypothetical protein
MTFLHFGIRGGPPTILEFIFLIVALIFFILLGIATNGFKNPHTKEEKNKSNKQTF